MKLELKHLSAYLPYGVRVLTTINIEGRPVIGTLNAYCISDILDAYIGERLILHPMSDLTKEIEHNGEKFVPINEVDKHHNFSLLRTYDLETDPTRYPYTVVQALLSWHFDIFNLIPSGLAVDVNTV